MDIRIDVSGMTCGGCKAAVERVLATQQGVSAVLVDLEKGFALVTAADTVSPSTLVSAVEDAGYDARQAF